MEFKSIHAGGESTDVRLYYWPADNERKYPRVHIGFGMNGAAIGMSVTCSPEEARELAANLVDILLLAEAGKDGAL